MSHDIFKPSNLIGCLENKTADSAQTRKRAIVTRPFPSPGGRGLGTRLESIVREFTDWECVQSESALSPSLNREFSVDRFWQLPGQLPLALRVVALALRR